MPNDIQKHTFIFQTKGGQQRRIQCASVVVDDVTVRFYSADDGIVALIPISALEFFELETTPNQ